MTPEVRAKLTPEVEADIIERIGASASSWEAKGGFESFVYEWTRPDGVVFVKATWGGRRTPEQIAAEMQFVRHLADADVPVGAPVALAGDSDVVTVPVDGGAFHLSATRQAPGRRIPKAELTPEHFEQYGSMLARMHQVAQISEVRGLMQHRPSWEDDHRALEPYAATPAILEGYRALLDQVATLPRAPDVYGLVHTDAHLGNVYFDGTHPTAFDFDDSLGFWYASDLAIVLFYTLNEPHGTAAMEEELVRNLASLRRGYERHSGLPEAAWQTLPLFLDLREAVLCLVVDRSVPAERQTGAFGVLVQGRRTRVAQQQHALGLTSDRWASLPAR